MRDGISALLEWSQGAIGALSGAYHSTLIDGQLADPVLITVKQILEAQRSSLDYLAWSITEAYGVPSDATYYPFATSHKDLMGRFSHDMEGVAEVAPEIADAIGRHQPYDHPALGYLNKLTRQVKHRHLSRHVRAERDGEVLVTPSGAEWWYGGGIPRWHVTPGMVRPGAGSVGTILLEWYFVEPHVPLLQTLTEIQSAGAAAVGDIRSVARV